jgi:hypothetical protein
MALKSLMKYAKLDPSEEEDFKLLFIQSLLSGFGASFFFVVVSTYFIKKTSVPSLPPAYIMSGIFGYLLITMYKKWQRKSGVVYSYTIGFAIYGLSGIVLYLGRMLFNDTSQVSVVIAYIGFVVVLPFASMQALGFSTICLRVFNIAQSKRLLALIGTGEVIASVIAYLMIPLLTKVLGGSAPLLLLSGIANMLAIIPLRKTYKHNKEKLDSIHFSAIKQKMNLAFFKKDKFYSLIAIVTVFSVMAVYFADYTYLLSVRYVAAESGMEIATVVAIVFSIIKTGELLASLLSGSIIRSYGMQVSLLLLPVLLVFSSLMGFSLGILFMNIPFFLVFFLLLNKWSERVIRKGVTIPAMKVVYQVTEPHERAQLQTSIDGIISQYATIAAGVFLLILSLLFSNNNILFFLRIVAFVYLIAFAGWSWFTFLLYSDYKVKIREYLHSFRRKAKTANDVKSGEDAEAAQESVSRHAIIVRAADRLGTLNEKKLVEYISYYNPSIRNVAEQASVLKKAKAAYYNNENFFSRLLIIRYLEFLDPNARLSFVREYYGISELQLRLELLAMLNKADYRVKPDDVFFFTGLCQDVASEIMWAESSINDIAGEVDARLVEALKSYVLTMQNLLFELLKVLYDKESIQVVHDIMKSRDQSLENQLFALELLDNVLDSQMKKLLMPVMEDISFSAKKERLQKTLLIYHLSCTERLKEILMSNFMTVGPYIKQLALEEYYRITKDQNVLNAFASSYVENLSATAAQLQNKTDKLYIDKIKAAESMNLPMELSPDNLVHFIKWGLFSDAKRRGTSGADEYLNRQTYQFSPEYLSSIKHDHTEMSIDTLGLSLILKMNQN